VLITSKSAPVVITFVDFNQPAYVPQCDGLLADIVSAFHRFWMATSEKTRDTLIQDSLWSNYVYQCEYNDGKHMVPLTQPQPHIVFTVINQCDQTGNCGLSRELSQVNGQLTFDWLLSIGVDSEFITPVQHTDTIDRQHLMRHNIFNPGEPTEGYVVYGLAEDGTVVYLVKVKHLSYILWRMIRQRLSSTTLDDFMTRLFAKRLDTENAYPSLEQTEKENLRQFVTLFYQWAIAHCSSKGVSAKDYVSHGPGGVGMATLITEFVAATGLSLETIFDPDFSTQFDAVDVSLPSPPPKGSLIFPPGRHIPLYKKALVSICGERNWIVKDIQTRGSRDMNGEFQFVSHDGTVTTFPFTGQASDLDAFVASV
jgi:hypothetical protein